jgi:hypothetical protein
MAKVVNEAEKTYPISLFYGRYLVVGYPRRFRIRAFWLRAVRNTAKGYSEGRDVGYGG